MKQLNVSEFQLVGSDFENVWVESCRMEDGVVPLWESHIKRLQNIFTQNNQFNIFKEQMLVQALIPLVESKQSGKLRIQLGYCHHELFFTMELIEVALVPQSISIKEIANWNETKFFTAKTKDLLDRMQQMAQLYDATFENTIVFIDDGKFLKETLWANIFLIKNGVLSTPSFRNCILPGIMRNLVLSNTDVIIKERDLTEEDLYEADEIVLTNAVRGIMPVEYCLGRKKETAISQKLQQSIHSKLFK